VIDEVIGTGSYINIIDLEILLDAGIPGCSIMLMTLLIQGE
jgi:hypothetical protein